MIHDLGYRRYAGARSGAGPIARSLFVTGLLNAYGIGRSGRAKALPIAYSVSMVLLGASLLLIYADLVKPVNLGG